VWPPEDSAEESASIRAQLVREIETLPQDDLQPRAIAILKAKNRLSTNDAKQVEDAFAARMAQQEPSVEALTPDEPTSAQAGLISPRPFLGPPEAVKRPRGRPRKTKAVIERAAGVASAPKVDDDPNMRVAKEPSNAPTRDLNATSVIKIDKSMLNFAEPRRVRDKTHLRFVALQPCLVCGRTPSDPHHLRFAQPRALGRKTSDEFVVPLCRTHHRLNHQVGDEVAWWRSSGIDPVQVANRLWGISRGVVDKTR
jgi:hypothetical protein